VDEYAEEASLLVALALAFGALASAQRPAPPSAPAGVAVGDWPEARGPNRDGLSKETGLVEKWALNGENFLWRVPYGGRSAPIVMGQPRLPAEPVRPRRGAAGAGHGPRRRHRQGRLGIQVQHLPERRAAAPRRLGLPAADPETGNIYALGVGATVIALSKDGKLVWERSVGEEFAAFTTHGGRTMSPIVDGNLVIVSAAISSWGTQAARAHRCIALDKRTGDIVWVARPGGPSLRHGYAAAAHRDDQRPALLISGHGDGAVHALKAADRREGLEATSLPSARSIPASSSRDRR
jgi:hypothetical protein